MNSLRCVRIGAAAVALLVGAAAAGDAQPLEPIRYLVRFPAPQTHYLEVEATVPAGGRASVDLMMPVWTPGSYLVREYARHVEGFAARDARGLPLAVEKIDTNRWRVAAGGASAVTIQYRVYAREMSVRTNWVDDRFALVNGAASFITVVEPGPRPHEVRLVLPPAWRQTRTALPAAPGGQPHHYLAPDFDTLVDSPIVAGNPAVYEFEVEGRRHSLVNVGEAGVWDGARAAADLERVVRQTQRFWRQLPYDQYLFLNLITEAGGGLEHQNSSVLMTTRWSTRTRQAYLGWLGVAAHELFHAWNGKRLRPVELGPFDYENENHTTSLWMAEGFTEYYADVRLHRAGLSSESAFLQAVSANIDSVQTTPGRLVQPVGMASFDAWIKYYRPDENSANTSISYYSKGAVLAFLLDAKVRRATGGARTLDEVMRAAYDRYSGRRGYSPEEFRALVEEVAGPSENLRSWFAGGVESAAELDYGEALDWFGLRFREGANAPPRAWLGAGTRNDEGRLVVTQVRRGGPAEAAGLNVEDEILAIDEFRVRAGQLDTRLAQYQPGAVVSVLVARRDELRRLDVGGAPAPPRQWHLEVAPASTPEQRRRRDAWLGATGG